MKYAAYGSNLHPVRLSDRLASTQLIGTASLPDWSLHFHKRSEDGSGKCSIQAGGDGVHLAIYDITPKDKLKLDEIEGVGTGYSEISLDVPGFGPLLSYVAMESYVDDSLQPYCWYKNLVLYGAMFHGFPDDYVRRIESQQAIEDPDPDRRQAQRKTVERVRCWQD